MFRYLLVALFALAVGVLFGAYAFSDTQPRSVLTLTNCEQKCLSKAEFFGLLASVGIQRFPAGIPGVKTETDKTLVIKHPFPQAPVHYVVIPKRDIKAIEDIEQEDEEYLSDAYAVMAELIKEQNLRDYKVIVNGPGFQTVGYLHFHIVSELPK